MTTHRSVDEMWLDVLGTLSALTVPQVESRAGPSAEVLGYSAVLSDLDRTFLLNKCRNLSPTYAAAELLWYLSGEDSLERLRPYAPSYSRFAEGDRAWGAYGHRWWADPTFLAESKQNPYGQICMAVELLLSRPTTRQCVVTAWNAGDLPHALLGDKADLPCTLAWQFVRREGKLHLVVTMRSEDAWLGLPYDVFVNTTMQRLVAAQAGLELGTYVHQVGCMHLYAANRQDAVKAFMPASAADARDRSSAYRHSGGPRAASVGWNSTAREYLSAQINCCLEAERRAREERSPMDEWYEDFAKKIQPSNPLHDVVLLCAAKWVPVGPNSLSSPLMREAYGANR